MTEDEARALYELEAADLELRFRSYYKFVFTFVGEMANMKVDVGLGGGSDDIYKETVGTWPFPAPLTWQDLNERYIWVSVRNKQNGITTIMIEIVQGVP